LRILNPLELAARHAWWAVMNVIRQTQSDKGTLKTCGFHSAFNSLNDGFSLGCDRRHGDSPGRFRPQTQAPCPSLAVVVWAAGPAAPIFDSRRQVDVQT
jgi:hypothetical protein